MDESRKRGDELYIYEKEGEVQADHYRYMMTLPGVRELLQDMLDAGLTIPTFQIDHYANFAYGNLIFITYEHFPEMHDIFKRFAKVFEQTYTRFLDLQKAEAQAREAQIEAALERVRSKTMAMHNSQDVGDTVATMFDELVKLGVKTVRCGIGILHEPNQMELWTAKKSETEKAELIIGRLDMTIHPLLQGVYNGWKNKDITFSYDLKGKDLVDYFTALINAPEYHINYDIASLPQQQFHNAFYFSEGALFAFSAEQLSAEASQIFKRFAGVFGQTYRRYLDLQKAEAQAREAKIETALERVRARTMAMQKSDELDETNMLIFRQLESLDITLSGTGIHICYADKPVSEAWMGDPLTGKMPKVIYNHTHDRLSEKMYEGWKKGETLLVEEVKGEKLKEHLEYVLPLLPDPTIYEDSIQEFVFHIVYFTYGFFVLATPDHCPTEHPVFIRFAKVFDQTYTRFLDLQKAEAQAREAKIEAALEKVRSRSLAMHKSDELYEVVTVVV